MDVVYNHTFAAGQDARAVLDRIVPGYYQRLDAVGAVTNSTCCDNTATELNGRPVRCRPTRRIEDSTLLTSDPLNPAKYQDGAAYDRLQRRARLDCPAAV